MNVLFAASEAAPFAKSGGLGDVIGSLPLALGDEETDVRVIMPKYNDIPNEYKEKMTKKMNFNVPVAWRNQYCGIEEYNMDGVTFYFIDNEYYFKRSGLYGYYDEAERFVFFSKAVLESLYHIGFKPDIIHCHDWQTALIPFFLKEYYRDSDYHQHIKTVFTIHNLKYQGVYGKDVLTDVIGADEEFSKNNALEFYEDINFMKAALYYSDKVTTVSDTYSKEIQQPYYGENLDGILREINYKLSGIVNGIDSNYYKEEFSILKKDQQKKELQQLCNLQVKPKIPVLSIVSRLVEQKGLDLIAHIVYEILAKDVQLIVLGTGEAKYENMFRKLQEIFPDKVRVYINFDVALAEKIYIGSDMFLMPSLFEPCGLAQMVSLSYGTIPIVRETGGLKDTIIPYNKMDGSGTGFTFANYNAHELLFKIKEAINLYNDEESWSRLVENAVKERFSWGNSAKQYKKIYKEIVT